MKILLVYSETPLTFEEGHNGSYFCYTGTENLISEIPQDVYLKTNVERIVV